jgi:hypothetical protein
MIFFYFDGNNSPLTVTAGATAITQMHHPKLTTHYSQLTTHHSTDVFPVFIT